MEKNMKKILSLIAILAICLTFCGCDRKPMTVTFQNATMAGSDQNTVNIFFADDKKFDEKVCDIWIKSDTDDVTLTINKSNQPKFKTYLKKKDMWYSMTTLELESDGKIAQEDYAMYKDAVDLVYVLQTNQKCKVTFKAVTGDKTKNAEETGFLIANAEDVSKEFTLELKPLKN